jgi:hypothetical protein
MLLDTCLIQHLEYVMDVLGEAFVWPENAQGWIRRRYGPELGEDLVALGNTVAFLYPRQDPPWAVSETSLGELSRIGGVKGSRLCGWWSDWALYWDGSAGNYPEVDSSGLFRPRVVEDPDQLRLFDVPALEPPAPADESFGPFVDAGDRALICDAIRSKVPAILTTDVRSFWVHRAWLYGAGVEVWRPRDLWAAMRPIAVRSNVA